VINEAHERPVNRPLAILVAFLLLTVQVFLVLNLRCILFPTLLFIDLQEIAISTSLSAALECIRGGEIVSIVESELEHVK
jgi:hypothetical protein